jgi:hypothetical protein
VEGKPGTMLVEDFNLRIKKKLAENSMRYLAKAASKGAWQRADAEFKAQLKLGDKVSF